MMYYGFFHIGEVTSGSHPIKVCNVEIAENKRKLKFTLFTSKTHGQNTRPQMIKIVSVLNTSDEDTSNLDKYCPFQMLRSYINRRKSFKTLHEPFFVFRDRTPV